MSFHNYYGYQPQADASHHQTHNRTSFQDDFIPDEGPHQWPGPSGTQGPGQNYQSGLSYPSFHNDDFASDSPPQSFGFNASNRSIPIVDSIAGLWELKRAIEPKPAMVHLSSLCNNPPEGKGRELNNKERWRICRQRGTDFNSVGRYEFAYQINGNEYRGEGSIRSEAKNEAAEMAFREEFCSQHFQKQRRKRGRPQPCPWNVLASLALNRLYEDWQERGFVIPQELSSQHNANNLKGLVLSGPSAGFDNWRRNAVSWNPLILVNNLVIKSGTFADYHLTCNKVSSGSEYLAELHIGNKAYEGTAKRSKREAKVSAAEAALEDKDSWSQPKEQREGNEKQSAGCKESRTEDAATEPGSSNSSNQTGEKEKSDTNKTTEIDQEEQNLAKRLKVDQNFADD